MDFATAGLLFAAFFLAVLFFARPWKRMSHEEQKSSEQAPAAASGAALAGADHVRDFTDAGSRYPVRPRTVANFHHRRRIRSVPLAFTRPERAPPRAATFASQSCAPSTEPPASPSTWRSGTRSTT